MAEPGILFEVSGAPYFIQESDNKVCYVVKKIVEPAGKDPNKKSWTYLSDTEHPLILHLDIKEIPTRNLSLLVRSFSNDRSIKAIIEDLKKLAGIAGCDYFGLEQIAGYGCVQIESEGPFKLLEVKPRLFRKIVND